MSAEDVDIAVAEEQMEAYAGAPEKCWGCLQIVKHYPEPVPMSAIAEVQGQDIPLCDMHWSWWVARWLNSDDEPGVSAHVINLPDPLPVHTNGGM